MGPRRPEFLKHAVSNGSLSSNQIGFVVLAASLRCLPAAARRRSAPRRAGLERGLPRLQLAVVQRGGRLAAASAPRPRGRATAPAPQARPRAAFARRVPALPRPRACAGHPKAPASHALPHSPAVSCHIPPFPPSSRPPPAAPGPPQRKIHMHRAAPRARPGTFRRHRPRPCGAHRCRSGSPQIEQRACPMAQPTETSFLMPPSMSAIRSALRSVRST